MLFLQGVAQSIRLRVHWKHCCCHRIAASRERLLPRRRARPGLRVVEATLVLLSSKESPVMTKTIHLTDLQLVLLAGAAARDSGSLIPLPERCQQESSRIGKSIASLLRGGLVEELVVTDRELAWRDEEQAMIGLFITQAGRDVLGAGAKEPEVKKVVTQPSPRPASKIGTVLLLMKRDEGATLGELVEATGWLPHTTRAALTGLRKKGHAVAKGKRGTATCYTILAEA